MEAHMGERLVNVPLSGGIFELKVPEARALLMARRQKFVEQYCREQGWDSSRLTLFQIFEIRIQPGWKCPA